MIQYKDSDMKSMVYAMLIQLLNHSQTDKKSPKKQLNPADTGRKLNVHKDVFWTSYVHFTPCVENFIFK